MVAYLMIIYKKQQNTKKIKKSHSKFEQEAALSGGSPAVHLTYLVARLPVREPEFCLETGAFFCFGFMFWNRFVRDESRSTTEVPLYL
jgi:hypothetical protein